MKITKLLKRWTQMASGKSAFNVKQSAGKYYKKDEIGGYYNDLTAKVEATKTFDEAGIPINKTVAGVTAHFPITIFQYALGLYDKFLETQDYSYLSKFMNIADWAVDTQKENGMWDCMSSLKDKAHKTQSSMCQGEGISVLARAYTQTHESMFKDAIIKAADFMLKETTEGGTATSKRDGLVLQEYVSRYNLSVLNGWIFSIFGLKDALLVTDDKKYELALDQSVNTLKRMLSKYDRGYWSSYDLKGTIASPAYHDLHIELLKVMEDLFDEKVFGIYAKKFSRYQENSSNRNKAIRQKLRQKLSKNNYYDLNTSLVD